MSSQFPSTSKSSLPTTQLISSIRFLIAFGLFIFTASIAVGYYFFIPSYTNAPSRLQAIKVISPAPSTTPTPTPDPFQELTIPYLRDRGYNSKLSDLQIISTNFRYTSYLTNYPSDSFTINGLLTIPTSEPPEDGWPAVIFLHGYIPPATYQTQKNYVSYVDYLARNDLVVFKIDLRGHGDSQGQASGAYYSGDYIIDTLNAHSALSQTDFVNPDRIGLWGHSMAGNIVLRTLAAKPDIPAAVIWAGAGYTYSDLQNFGIQDNSYRRPSPDSQRQQRRQLLRDLHGTFNPDDPFWQQVPATNYLSDIQGAIQIHHAVNDPVVSIQYSRNLIQILDQTSIFHQLFEYPNGGHNLSGSSFNTAMARTAEFYQNQL